MQLIRLIGWLASMSQCHR